jgi:signal transduction histidine kinase
LGTGTKVAIGCGIAVILAGVVVAAAVFGGLWWAKGKVEEVAGNETRIEELKKKANAVPFTTPEDGIVREDRLVKFLDIRKRVYAVYEKHKDALEAMNKKKQADFGDVTKGLSVLNEVRTAQAQALADVGMSEDEYHFMVEQVYKTLWASEVAKQTGGKSTSEALAETYDKAADEMEKLRQAQAAASPTAPARTAEEREAAEKAQRDLDRAAADARKQGTEVRESAKDLDVPPANIALFRKYEAEIKKYAMGGLEWMGL